MHMDNDRCWRGPWRLGPFRPESLRSNSPDVTTGVLLGTTQPVNHAPTPNKKYFRELPGSLFSVLLNQPQPRRHHYRCDCAYPTITYTSLGPSREWGHNKLPLCGDALLMLIVFPVVHLRNLDTTSNRLHLP